MDGCFGDSKKVARHVSLRDERLDPSVAGLSSLREV